MIRNRERLITLATVLTVTCCVVTLWTTTNVTYRVREIHASNSGGQPLDESVNVKPNLVRIVQEVISSNSNVEDLVKTKDTPELEYDTWSTDGAIAILEKYNKYLNKDRKPITADPGNDSTITEWWQAVAMCSWYLHSPLRYTCKQKLTWLGGWAVCQDVPYTVKAPCLVYSFGIAYDFAFDDDAAKVGCDVRSFDPSMTNISDHQRSSNVWFYRYGLSDRNTNSFKPDFDEYVTRTQTWKMRTLKDIMTELGHLGRTIDILKIDIESTEWSVFENLMDTDMLKYVRHLLVEYHYFPTRPPKADYVHFFQVYTKLRRMGFREYYNRPHSEFLIPEAYRHQGESFYINVNFHPSNM